MGHLGQWQDFALRWGSRGAGPSSDECAIGRERASFTDQAELQPSVYRVSDPRVLIYGSSWVNNFHVRDLCKLWAKVTRYLNPNERIVLLDSDSPIKPSEFMPTEFEIEHYQFGDNPGHLHRHGQGDGAGRALCKGIELAIDDNYDYVVYIEGDLIFAHPVMPIIKRMAKHGIRFAAVMDTTYFFLEGGLYFMDVAYLKATDFIGRYDWQDNSPERQTEEPEFRTEKIVKDELWLLPLRGLRNDYNQVTRSNLMSHRRGLDYITHCRDFGLYAKFIEMNGIKFDGG